MEIHKFRLAIFLPSALPELSRLRDPSNRAIASWLMVGSRGSALVASMSVVGGKCCQLFFGRASAPRDRGSRILRSQFQITCW